MGILNVTPDSFSDGGKFVGVDAAVRHGLALVAAGAAILDIGGESSRPGADPVSTADELARVVPVVERLAAEVDIPISIDTTKAEVADAALSAGATIVNDISGAQHDSLMLGTVVAHDAAVVLMHMQGEPRTMQVDPHYDDVVQDVCRYLQRRTEAAISAGVRSDAIVVDPGLGFGKTYAHNVELLDGVEALVHDLDVPLLIGASRKSFLGTMLSGAAVTDRESATVATSVLAFLHGAAIVRVHDVAASVAAARVLDSVTVRTRQGVMA